MFVFGYFFWTKQYPIYVCDNFSCHDMVLLFLEDVENYFIYEVYVKSSLKFAI